MKTKFIWRKCYTNNNKDSFWIECSDQEVIDHILPIANQYAGLIDKPKSFRTPR